MNPFEIMQNYYKERDLAAKEWKQSGKKVVGYFCTQVPEELILAAGFFPVRISGDPNDKSDLADKYAPPSYEGFVRSMFNLILSQKYDFVDYLIIPHSRDSIHTLHALLGFVKEIEPEIKLPEIYLLDTLHTRSYLVGLYIKDRMTDLKNQLEGWSGKKITEESVRQAVLICNANRMLLNEVAKLRNSEPCRISGTEALQIIGSSMFMLKEEHNNLLRQFIENVESMPEKTGVRLFVEGSPMDNMKFYEVLESCGALVVAEDNCWGNRYKDDFVKISSNLIESIAERYQLKSPCPRNFPLTMRVDNCVNGAIESKAKAVIFNVHEYDYAQTWETPEEISSLQGKNIPSLWLKKQQYSLTPEDEEALRKSIKQFLGTL
ncbi:MAG: 2-hydroxyacyl-CoA dehydratase [Dehalococcoidales bacterium]|nr:2-hydroxyacyl-CoA dehydratase [Dehalococcoidales bacterium]